MGSRAEEIDTFHFPEGKILAGKYEVIDFLGEGWEGEVYMIREQSTGIERAAKLFYPKRNPYKRISTRNAKKLHKLRDCPILIQYHTQEEIQYKKTPVTALISDYVEGELLKEFLKRQPGKRISVFQGLHLLHALAVGLECIHNRREYHGDLHAENIIVHRHGLGFDLKLLDLFHRGRPSKFDYQEDIIEAIRIFYDAIGGKERYPKQPDEAKAICCGLRKSLILKKFRTASKLREYLETMSWG